MAANLNSEAWLKRLVAFDTTSANSNLALIEDVAGYLDRLGVRAHLVRNDEGDKANLYATIGPDDRGGVVLSGHSDVVPVTGQPWRTDPFALHAAEGKLYGRGAADMKGFIACVLAAVPALVERRLATPVHIALSYDEEVGCVGVRRLLDMIRAELPLPAAVIVGEPTGMRVVNAHKGISVQTTTVTGRDGHSSAPDRGVSAIAYSAEIIRFLAGLARELASKGGADPRFEPPGTTLNVGTIWGGTAVNIIARECSFRWEFRSIPDADPAAVLARFDAFVAAEILPRMRAVHPDATVVTEVRAGSPALRAEPDSPAEVLARRLTGANESHAVAFVCEAGLFRQAGIPAVVCGPGEISEAHQPNEFIARDQLTACDAFLARLIDYVAG